MWKIYLRLPERSVFVQFTHITARLADDVQDLRPPIALTPSSPKSPLSPSLILSSGQTITLLDRHFAPSKSWKAWEGYGRGIFLIEAGGLLVAIGDEDGSPFPVLKIWDLTRDEKKKAGG